MTVQARAENLFQSQKKYTILLSLFFIAVGFLLYSSVFQNNFVTLDDDILIYENPIVFDINFRNISKAFTTYDPELYIPLTILSYQVDYAISNGQAWSFHMTNLLLHIANTLLLYLAIYLYKNNKFLAFFCSALFLIHPINVETVAWASARKDLLSSFFFLGSIGTYIKFQSSQQQKMYYSSIILFTLSLLSKVSSMVLPVILVLLDLGSGKKIDKQYIKQLAPFVALSCVFLLVALIGKPNTGGNFVESILLGGRSIFHYVYKIFIPTTYSVFYNYTQEISVRNLPIVLAWLAVIGALMGASSHYKKYPHLLGGLLFFVACLFPSFFNSHKIDGVFLASDRYAYIASIGIFYILGVECWKFLQKNQKYQWHIYMLLLIIFATLGTKTFHQTSVWKNTETLFADSLSGSKASHAALNNVGVDLVKNGEYINAIELFSSAVELHPTSIRSRLNLATTYAKIQEFEKAHAEIDVALQLAPSNAEVYAKLGEIYSLQRRKEEAFTMYSKAMELDPAWFENWFNKMQQKQ